MRYKALLLIVIVSIMTTNPVYAGGMAVIDIAGLSQQITSYGVIIKQYATQAQQYASQIQSLQYQYSQLQNDYTNLTNLNFKGNLSGLSNMQNVMNAAVGMSGDVSLMQQKFENLYPDFSKYQTQNGSSFSQQSAQWSRQNQLSALDTMRVTSAIQQNISEDGSTLRNLNDLSDKASGVKDLLQITNQLLIMQIKQLTQLQQIFSTTANADSAYHAELASKEAVASARSKNSVSNWSVKGKQVVNPYLDKLY